ncbi:hypothetical protein [Actinokineospora pegani]|uniref:hypothetical protein n=1 Tax=Actinokineospora pegani TaxID=2654637 RepID=UPI0012EA8FEB|nr:hypothetical protein [Actinokineospora pegani]
MATFGELIPGQKLRKVTEEEGGSGQLAEPRGPLDLDSGVVFLPAKPAAETDKSDDRQKNAE